MLFSLCCSLFKGESGLGKSTLVNSLFLTDLYKDRKLLNAEGKEAVAFDPGCMFSALFDKCLACYISKT